MDKASAWANIPEELKSLPQWCVSLYTHPDKNRQKAPRTPRGTGEFAKVDDKSTWGTFEEAATFAYHRGTDNWCIGFVLSAEDPFCVVDLDVKDAINAPDKPHMWTSMEEMEQYWEMAQLAESYVERSLSGKSLHILCRANIGPGARWKGVEVYSQGRYIICTGDVMIDKPLRDNQVMIEKTVRNLRQLQEDIRIELDESIEEEQTDDDIIGHLTSAENADKFNELFAGRYEQFGYPSQSEADLALMSMFAFYSDCNEQCRRMFRASGLGDRDKAVRNDKYLNFTLSVVRGRQERERRIDAAALVSQQLKLASRLSSPLPAPAPPQPATVAPGTTPQAPHAPTLTVCAAAALPLPATLAQPSEFGNVSPKQIDWPPGFLGVLAKFMYSSAPRPVREVAIVAAFGLMAGFAGKAFSIPQSGLNVYFVLVARSALGKEAMHSGIAFIMEALRTRAPTSMTFVDFSSFASGPALIKACIGNPSFVNVNGEWGKQLKRMAEDVHGDSSIQTLRTVMTNLYQKSGPSSIVGGVKYSNKENNVESVSGVSYSMIGETTPSTYYESLTDSMMEDGFLSRFTHLECDSERPRRNLTPITTLDAGVADYLSKLVSHCAARTTGLNTSISVMFTAEALEALDAFDIECDDQINGKTDEGWRQMWNRAHLKALRFAALMAVGDNFIEPVIERRHADWAIDLIRRDITLMQKKIKEGDVGKGDDARERKLMSILKDYLEKPIPSGYEVPTGMQKAFIIQRKYIQLRVQRISSFTRHRSGSAIAALDLSLKSLIDSGYIREVPRDKLVKDFGFQGKCYQILDLPK